MKHSWLRYACFAILASGTLLAAAGAFAQVKLTPFRSEITFNFQNERAAQSRSIRLDLSETSTTTPTAVVMGGFTSTTGPFVVPAEDVEIAVAIDSASETVEMDVSVDPTIDQWKAGEFTSSIRVAGEGYDSATIPVKLTFRSGSPVGGTAVALVTLVVGVAVGLLFKASGTKTQTVTTGSPQRRLVIKGAVLLTGIVTAVAVVIFGFDTQYLNNDTFGAGGLSDWLALFAWGFGAGFSGKKFLTSPLRERVPRLPTASRSFRVQVPSVRLMSAAPSSARATGLALRTPPQATPPGRPGTKEFLDLRSNPHLRLRPWCVPSKARRG